jgi:hypothetical protein
MFSSNDMIFTMENGEMLSGGYKVDSPFLNGGIPVSYHLNKEKSSLFGGLVVPSGLLYLTSQSKLTDEMDKITNDELIGGDLYDKLFNLAQTQHVPNKIKPKLNSLNNDLISDEITDEKNEDEKEDEEENEVDEEEENEVDEEENEEEETKVYEKKINKINKLNKTISKPKKIKSKKQNKPKQNKTKQNKNKLNKTQKTH